MRFMLAGVRHKMTVLMYTERWVCDTTVDGQYLHIHARQSSLDKKKGYANKKRIMVDGLKGNVER